jgi:aryl-alcohol dehydrogenase-like predicted oxidoreductase
MIVLGRTGLPVSRLGLGLAALGRPGYINLGHADDLHRDYRVEAMEARAAAVLDAAHAAGIRYLDAARSYGRAEAFLAAWLARRGHPPGSITVGSKWGYTYTAGWRVEAEHHEVKDHSRAVFERQLGESRALLGAHLQLYQIHSATLDSGVLDDPDTLRALAARATKASRSASRSAVRARRRPCTRRSRSASTERRCSVPCRRPGTCSNAPPAMRCTPPTTPASASSSRKASPTAGSPTATPS